MPVLLANVYAVPAFVARSAAAVYVLIPLTGSPFRIFICPECFEQYDTKIQDRPILKKGFKVTPYSDISRYPKADDGDIDIPFMKGINLDEQQDSEIEILRTSQDGRIQNIRIRDNVTREEAFRRMRKL